LDAVNVDLKAFTEDFYRKVSMGRLQPVLDTLVYMKRNTNVWIELTNLLIRGLNESDDELQDMTRWVVENLGPEIPMHFSAFHPDLKMRDRPSTTPETRYKARRIALDSDYAYTGNLLDETTDCTYCRWCGAKLIGRDGYVPQRVEIGRRWTLSPMRNKARRCLRRFTISAS
jgi:pyruvate formate lyase activating enzyme